MIKLLINFLIFLLLISCQLNDENTFSKNKNIDFNKESISILKKNSVTKRKVISQNQNTIKYLVEDPYDIDGVKYIPGEDYNYNQIGLATFYGKELHNIKTVNNDLNKVTELLGRHKTLPLPSIVKVTNLENGLSIIIKINDRHKDNSSLIQVSRKSAQLLKFYKNKITKVRLEILPDPSKQMKIVTNSMNENNFNETVTSAPTEAVSISNLDINLIDNKTNKILEKPIEIGFEEIDQKTLYLKVYGFDSYNSIKNTISELNISNKFTTETNNNEFIVIIGPLDNIDANKLVLSFISKGYKKNEFILE